MQNENQLLAKAPEPIDREELLEALRKGYGTSHPERINGFAGTFLFSVGDVYVTPKLNELVTADKEFKDTLLLIAKEFAENNKWGEITSDEEDWNTSSRYFGRGTDMIGRYTTKYGQIKLETYGDHSLFSFVSETGGIDVESV